MFHGVTSKWWPLKTPVLGPRRERSSRDESSRISWYPRLLWQDPGNPFPFSLIFINPGVWNQPVDNTLGDSSPERGTQVQNGGFVHQTFTKPRFSINSSSFTGRKRVFLGVVLHSGFHWPFPSIRTYMCNIHIHTYAYIYIRIHTYTYVYIHTYITHKHIGTHGHTYVHTCYT